MGLHAANSAANFTVGRRITLGQVGSVAWQKSIEQWRRLPVEEQRRVWWALIPKQVGDSMAFEREPVDLSWLETLHNTQALPAISKPPKES